MCMSFTDLSTTRQEEIWVHTVEIGKGGAYWAARANHYRDYIAEELALMSRPALVAHLADVNKRTAAEWAPVRALVEAELSSRDNVADLVPAPQSVPEVALVA